MVTDKTDTPPGRRVTFTDPVCGQPRILVIPAGGALAPGRGGGPKIGVEHPGCAHLADVTPGLDAWYCPACRAGGRISGAWCLDMIGTRP